MSLVSVVIPCHNSARYLEQTLASVRAQTHPAVETILVNDGTDDPHGVSLLHKLSAAVDHYIELPHSGLPAARNAGVRIARGDYFVPLDADDLLSPTYIAECLEALERRQKASFLHAEFLHTDYCVFGDARYTERLGDYNLFELLHQNTLTYAALIAKSAWEHAGGYDEAMRLGYEDWDFWLRLAEHGCFGARLPRALFHYRKRAGSMFSVARTRHDALIEHLRANHPGMYSPEGLARIKAQWSPAACVAGAAGQQTLADIQTVPAADPDQLLEACAAEAFLIPASPHQVDSHSAELCALAVWAGRDAIRLPDGSLSLSRRSLEKMGGIMRVPAPRKDRARDSRRRVFSGIYRHLLNAELLSKEAWLSHPVRSAARLIPLHAKEFINRMYPVFDLSFYLQFRPRSLEIGHQVVTPLRYYPQPSAGRQRIAFVTPHLGPGGAEKSLLDIVESLDRAQFEIFLIATHPGGAEWRKKWNSVADHVYDLGGLIPAEKMPGAVYSLTANWKFETLVVQNSLPAYAAVLNIRRDSPGIKVIDIVHAVGDDRDLVQATQAADPHIDLRIAISEAARARLLDTGTAGERIRLIRNGIDLAHFRPAAARAADPAPTVLFAGRLDPVKRPLMLVDIALELKKLALSAGTRFLVAGDGPEWGRLQDRVQGAKLREEFVFLGAVDDIRPVLAQAHVVVLPSQWEGIPFIVLEALALERPVVCSQVGALDEVVSPHTGILVKTGQGEVRRFAMALQSLLSDPRRRRAMGEAGRRMVERDYDQARSRRQYQELFA